MKYLNTISRKFPELQVSVIGDSEAYESLTVEPGSVLPTQAELDAAYIGCMKEDMWLAIKAERDRRKSAGVKVGNYWFHSDDASRIQHIGLVMLGSNMAPDLMWKTLTGEFVNMTPALAAQVFQMVAYYDQTNFANAERHRQAMMALEDPTEYDFSTGWLQAYTDIGGTLP